MAQLLNKPDDFVYQLRVCSALICQELGCVIGLIQLITSDVTLRQPHVNRGLAGVGAIP